jgi:hypothetical protein
MKSVGGFALSRATIFSLAAWLFCLVLPADADVVRGTYIGSSKTNVRYLNPATLAVVSAESYSGKMNVTILPPRQNGSITESNPFSLTLTPFARGDGLTAGQVFAASARVFVVNGGSILLQYWDLSNTVDGFVGSLINNHLADGAGKERVIALLGGPGGTPRKFFMHDASIGAALQCTITATTIGRLLTLKLTGYAFIPGQAIVRFTTKISARRS